MNNQYVVNATKLSYSFGSGPLRQQILFDVDLYLSPGEIVILTGPSGSGKTTLLTLVGALRKVQTGSLDVLGTQLYQADTDVLVGVRRKIGYIFQSHNLLKFLTAQQNIEMALQLDTNISSQAAVVRAEHMLEAVGLHEHRRNYPDELSVGQKQRVAVARALVGCPKLILADEPTASLDSKSGRTVVDTLHRLAQEQKSAILLVTHDTRIFDIAHRIIYMEDGQLKPSSLYA